MISNREVNFNYIMNDDIKIYHFMIIGGVSASIAEIATIPFDTIKVRM